MRAFINTNRETCSCQYITVNSKLWEDTPTTCACHVHMSMEFKITPN